MHGGGAAASGPGAYARGFTGMQRGKWSGAFCHWAPTTRTKLACGKMLPAPYTTLYRFEPSRLGDRFQQLFLATCVGWVPAPTSPGAGRIAR